MLSNTLPRLSHLRSNSVFNPEDSPSELPAPDTTLKGNHISRRSLSVLTQSVVETPSASNGGKDTTPPAAGFHPLLRDLVVTIATEFGILVSGLLLVSLVGRLLGPVALGEYLLVRRVQAWLIAGVLLGMANALPRYIAHSIKKPERERRVYFLVASLLMAVAVCVVGVVLCLGRFTFARWLFGTAQLANLILPLVLMLAGLAAETAAYGYFRGKLALGRANAILFFELAVIPLVAIAAFYRTQSVALIVGATGALTLVGGAIFAWPIARQLASDTLPKLKTYASELLFYGVGRVPGDFGSAALFALGPVIAAHYLPMKEVAYLLLGANLLLVTGYVAGPLSVVFLSKFSMMLAQNRRDDVRKALDYMMSAVLELGIFGGLQLGVFADMLVRLWVGPQYLAGMTVIRLLILAIPPYLFFMALRSGIDAVTVKPRNAGNVLVSLMVYLVLIAGVFKMLPANLWLDGIAGAMLLSCCILGGLTALTYRDLYDLGVPWGRCAPGIIAGLLLGALSFAFRWFCGFHETPLEGILVLFLTCGLFLGTLFKLRSPWFEFVWRNTSAGRNLSWLISKGSPA